MWAMLSITEHPSAFTSGDGEGDDDDHDDDDDDDYYDFMSSYG